MSEVKIGDRVRVAGNDRSSYYGKEGTVVASGPFEFGDEVTLHLDGGRPGQNYYFTTNVVEKIEPAPEPAPADASSFQFFETLLGAAEEAHPSSKMFYNELIDCGLLHAQKQRDYGKPGDPFANVRSTEEWGIPAWVGAMVRLNDKVKRLQALARTGGLANESAIDSFRDIAVYALIALVLYQQDSASGASAA